MAGILICDDDREIATAIAVYLKNEGYETFLAHDGRESLSVLEDNDIQLIIMDIMMPNMDGLSATMEIRQSRNIPIIMLSAKSEDADKIIGLSAGADDYVTKPFNPLELIARVKSQLRRFTVLGSLPSPEDGVYTVGGVTIDDNHKSVTVDGESVRLTPLEYKIALLLIRHPGRVFSIDEIYERVWGEDAFCADNAIAVHIRRIREKIEIDPKNPRYLKVVWGLGYKMEKI
ncbi:MAG: response regulator transcription factor [Oscillospiraceae bacterium]|nr:response regulator transcription factor [Oscillospiraceae bacterium]MCL2278042.1 response regulator transcription factor [Oscillospiraceae bacterium]